MSALDWILLAALLAVGGWRWLAPGRALRARRIACGAVAGLAVAHLAVHGFTWQFVTGYTLLAAAATGPAPGGRLARGLAAGGIGALVVLAVLPFALLPTPVLPKPTGPHAVGTKVYRWVDPAREETATAAEGDRRNVIVQAWYPAAPGAEGPPAPYIDGLGRLPAKVQVFPAFVFGRFGDIDTHAVRDAPAQAARTGWPVVVFSPGYGATRAAYAGLLADLASRGYVVLALDHPYEVAVTELADGRVVGPAQVFPRRDEDWVVYMDAQVHIRAADVRFVLDRLPGLARELRIDPAKVGVIGHSFGGATAAVAAAQDPRVRAASDIDGALYGAVWEESLKAPFLLIESDRGETGHGEYYLDGTATLLGNLAAPGWRYQIARANHFSFSDAMLFFSAPGRAAVALALGGGRGPVATQRATADLLDAFLSGPLDGRPASLEAAAARQAGVTGGRVR